MPNNPVVSDTTWPPGLALEVTTLDVPIIAIRDGARHMFDFSYDGKECCCYVTSRLMVPEVFRIGQTVRITGEWSTAILRVFNALAVTVLAEG